MMLSWNAGGGCRNLMDIIRRSGYNLVILQEAWDHTAAQFPEGWAVTVQFHQLFAARMPVPALELPAASAARLKPSVQPHWICLFSHIDAACSATLTPSVHPH